MPTSARAEQSVFTELFGEFVTTQTGRQSRRPLQQGFAAPVLRRGGRLCPPAEYTDFTGISGDFAASQRADVGIGP